MATKRTNRKISDEEKARQEAQAETRRWLEAHPESDEAAARGFEQIRRGNYVEAEIKRPTKKP